MLRSMFAGVSGLRSHQTMMDVVGNNIANVNTSGFKSSRVTFQDTLSQMQRGGAGAANGQGGVNPMQIGLGVRVGAIDTVATQGGLQATGRTTDLAIQGEGHFMVRSGQQTLYTRSGALGFDSLGNLVDPSGFVVRGFMADGAGRINPNGQVSDIRLPLGQSVAPNATDVVTLGGNLGAGSGEPVVNSIQVYDDLGTAHLVSFTYTPVAETPGAWTLTATDAAGTELGSADLTFDPITGLRTGPTGPMTFDRPGGPNGSFSVDIGAIPAPGEAPPAGALTQYGGPTTAKAVDQDGAATGYLRSFTISDDGTVSGVFSNGVSKPLAQIALAVFANPGGLVKMGDNHFRGDNNAGVPAIGVPGAPGVGTVAAGSLEMSNVDLAQEFTNLIIAQRGFQANSRIISASDELLQDVVNIKR